MLYCRISKTTSPRKKRLPQIKVELRTVFIEVIMVAWINVKSIRRSRSETAGCGRSKGSTVLPEYLALYHLIFKMASFNLNLFEYQRRSNTPWLTHDCATGDVHKRPQVRTLINVMLFVFPSCSRNGNKNTCDNS